MPIPRDIASEINRILAAIRAGLDASSYPAGFARQHLDEIRSAYLRFEEIRFAYRAHTGKNLGPVEGQDEALIELARSLADLLKDQTFADLSHAGRFRPLNMTRPSKGFALHPGLMQPRLSIYDALSFFLDGLSRFPIQLDWAGDGDDDALTKLREVLPSEQGIAPVQFGISDGRLVIAHQPAIPDGEDQANVLSARHELANQAQRIIDQLRQSNCDKRLLDTVEYLKCGLESDADVIRLGLSNIACDAMRQQFEDELPDAIAAMLSSQSTGVSLYVAQFSEWHRFTENAAQSQISTTDAPRVARAITDILSNLESKPEAADPDVPRTLAWLKSFVDDPGKTTKSQHISTYPDRDRDRLLRGQRLPEPTEAEADRLIYRSWFVEGNDDAIYDAINLFFEAVRGRWPHAWNSTGQGYILPRTNGYLALMRFLRDATLHWAGPSRPVTLEQHAKLLQRVSLKDDDLTTVNFEPGTGGEARLYRTLKEQALG